MMFKLDRTKFKMQTFDEASNTVSYWKHKSAAEILSSTAYLNSIAFNYDAENPPVLNRTKFSMRKRN